MSPDLETLGPARAPYALTPCVMRHDLFETVSSLCREPFPALMDGKIFSQSLNQDSKRVSHFEGWTAGSDSNACMMIDCLPMVSVCRWNAYGRVVSPRNLRPLIRGSKTSPPALSFARGSGTSLTDDCGSRSGIGRNCWATRNWSRCFVERRSDEESYSFAQGKMLSAIERSR